MITIWVRRNTLSDGSTTDDIMLQDGPDGPVLELNYAGLGAYATAHHLAEQCGNLHLGPIEVRHS